MMKKEFNKSSYTILQMADLLGVKRKIQGRFPDFMNDVVDARTLEFQKGFEC